MTNTTRQLVEYANSMRQREVPSQLSLDRQTARSETGEVYLTSTDGVRELAHALVDVLALLPVDDAGGTCIRFLDGIEWMPRVDAAKAMDAHALAFAICQRVLDDEQLSTFGHSRFADGGTFSVRAVLG